MRKPSGLYSLFLQERFLQWKINQLVLDKKVEYDDDDFLEDYFRSHPFDQNQMCEYYLHGFLLGHFTNLY